MSLPEDELRKLEAMDEDEVLEEYLLEFPYIVKSIKNGEYETADLILKMLMVKSFWKLESRLELIDAGISELKEELEILQRGSH